MGLPKKTGWQRAAEGIARRRHEHEPRHQDAFFGSEEGSAFLLGVWVPCRSSFWKSCRYLADEERLEVEFANKNKAPTYGAYLGVPFEVAEKFASSPSKGGFMHDVLIPGYQFVRG